MHIFFILGNNKIGENMKVKDIMNQNIITANKNESIYDIAKKMKEYDIGLIPICDKKKIIGILTDRDICIKILANKDLENIESYLTKNIITIEKEEDIKEAQKQMEKNKIKRILVTEKEEIIGIISLSDIIENIEDSSILNTIKTIFKKEVSLREKTAEIDSFYL